MVQHHLRRRPVQHARLLLRAPHVTIRCMDIYHGVEGFLLKGWTDLRPAWEGEKLGYDGYGPESSAGH